jgi:ABC-type lipoprotein export system ATPase subunit
LNFELFSAHAAGAIAMVMVGMKMEVEPGVPLVTDDMLNGVVIMILFTCIISTIVTERAAQQITLRDKEMPEDSTANDGEEKVLIPMRYPEYAQRLVNLAMMMRSPKNTTQIMGTLDSPDSGEIVVDGVDVRSLSTKKLSDFRNRHIGFVFQFHQLLPEFTALENVMIPAFIGGKSQAEAKKRAMELLEFMGLAERASHKPAELSGGEKQRVAVARALVNNPAVVFADEPSGSLDSKNKAELHQLFLRMKKLLEQHGMMRTFDMYLCKINLADVYLNLGKLNDATAMLDDVEPYFRAQGDNTSIYYCNTIRFGIAVRAGRMHEAERIMADKTDDSLIPYTLVNIRNKYKRRYYELTGNYDKAYALLNKSIAYHDSIEHNLSNMRTAEIMSRFTTDTLQLHRDLAIEHKNTEIQSIKFTSTLAISIAVTSILLLILWVLYLRKRRFKVQLNMMNLKLDNVRNRISPHFMFNVLNNRIIKSDAKETNELTELAQLIRANLDMSSTLGVELQKELEFVQQYIRVESYLMGDDFHFNIDIAPDVDASSVRIPSMFIQIMTENSIKHALRNKEGIKLLSITVRHEHNNTVIRVTDNGPGFNPVTLRRKTGMNIISQTIAVINLHNKDKIRFDIHNIYSSDGKQIKGCEAMLKVPDGVKIE